MTADAFTTAYNGQTWTVDIAEASPNHAIARSRHGSTVHYQAVTYSKSPHYNVDAWSCDTKMHPSLEAARAALVEGRTFTASPDSRLERIARTAIRRTVA